MYQPNPIVLACMHTECYVCCVHTAAHAHGRLWPLTRARGQSIHSLGLHMRCFNVADICWLAGTRFQWNIECIHAKFFLLACKWGKVNIATFMCRQKWCQTEAKFMGQKLIKEAEPSKGWLLHLLFFLLLFQIHLKFEMRYLQFDSHKIFADICFVIFGRHVLHFQMVLILVNTVHIVNRRLFHSSVSLIRGKLLNYRMERVLAGILHPYVSTEAGNRATSCSGPDICT